MFLRNRVFTGKSIQIRTYNIYGDFPEYTRTATQKYTTVGDSSNSIRYTYKKCVIGERTQKELLEKNEDPVGKFIRIDNIYFQVIGVHKYIEVVVLKVMETCYLLFNLSKTIQYRR